MSWSWLTSEWRLKVLAVGLAVLMLGAVAFSQNPPTEKTLDNVSIAYAVGPTTSLIVINPPTTISGVVVQGLGDTLQAMTSRNVSATFDLTKVQPGTAVRVNLVIKSLIAPVSVVNPVVPYVLNIDRLASMSVVVEPRVQSVAFGWKVNKIVAVCPGTPPCSVTLTGPASWRSGLKAYVDFTQPVQQNVIDVLTQPVTIELNGQPLDIDTARTEPPLTLDPPTVGIHIEAATGTTSRTVALLDAPYLHSPAQGYRVTGVTINPGTVVITGDQTLLAKIGSITLPPIDVAGRTSDFTTQATIAYPSGVSGNISSASITYSISANPNVSPPP
ncbi:MAG TPA: CdaR family protein [Candidatus Dormibacteraeota bacterium]